MKLEFRSFESLMDLPFLTSCILAAAAFFLLASPTPFFGNPWMKPAPFSKNGILREMSTDFSALGPLLDFEKVFEQSSLFGLLNRQKNILVVSASIAELSKDLRLKGLVLGGEPEAILEDARTQRSLFVKKGDRVGELEVKEVRTESVLLTANGEEKELRLQG